MAWSAAPSRRLLQQQQPTVRRQPAPARAAMQPASNGDFDEQNGLDDEDVIWEPLSRDDSDTAALDNAGVPLDGACQD